MYSKKKLQNKNNSPCKLQQDKVCHGEIIYMAEEWTPHDQNQVRDNSRKLFGICKHCINHDVLQGFEMS